MQKAYPKRCYTFWILRQQSKKYYFEEFLTIQNMLTFLDYRNLHSILLSAQCQASSSAYSFSLCNISHGSTEVSSPPSRPSFPENWTLHTELERPISKKNFLLNSQLTSGQDSIADELCKGTKCSALALKQALNSHPLGQEVVITSRYLRQGSFKKYTPITPTLERK